MIDLSEEFIEFSDRNPGVILFVNTVDRIIGRRYEATSISDFIENRHKTVTTHSLLRGDMVNVSFNNVNYRKEHDKHQLYDLSGWVDIQFHWFYSNIFAEYTKNKPFKFELDLSTLSLNQGRLYEVVTLYDKTKDILYLDRIDKYGPPKEEENSIENRLDLQNLRPT